MNSPTPFVFQPDRLADYVLTVSVGDVQSDDGQTEVTLRGDGAVTAHQRRDAAKTEREPSEVRDTIGREQAEFVMRSASQFEWAAAFPPRPGIPDEAIVSWSMSGPGQPALRTRMWLRDAEKHGLAGGVLSVLRQALRKASDGQLYL